MVVKKRLESCCIISKIVLIYGWFIFGCQWNVAMWLFIKNLIFTIFVPGMVAFYIPYRILEVQMDSFSIQWGVLQYLSLPIFIMGVSIYFRCLWDFAVAGRGTPAPIDPPKHLVVSGLYRYVRNPMYVGVLAIILGWDTLYESSALFYYFALMWVLFYLVVLIYEEPILRSRFGESYENYCKRVRRWIPGRKYSQTT